MNYVSRKYIPRPFLINFNFKDFILFHALFDQLLHLCLVCTTVPPGSCGVATVKTSCSIQRLHGRSPHFLLAVKPNLAPITIPAMANTNRPFLVIMVSSHTHTDTHSCNLALHFLCCCASVNQLSPPPRLGFRQEHNST